MTHKYIAVTLIAFLFLSCSSNNPPAKTPISQSTQGTRILGMDVKEVPSTTYATAYVQAMNLGVREVSVSLNWALLEASAGTYDNTLADIIDTFYPLQKSSLTLVLRPLDTPGPSLPAELTEMAFDDPAVITAFDNFLTNLRAQLPNLNASGNLKWIHVGNEIDAYLGTNSLRWQQWQTFFIAAKIKIKNLWGADINVGSIIQFSALTDTNKLRFYQNLLPELDNAALTYYPLNSDFTMRPTSTVENDFSFMVNTLANKTILLQECGYPSSSTNNSNETRQADFISAVFAAWDKYETQIRLIDFTWQYDVSAAQVDQWVIDFGMTGQPNEQAFKTYLGTLGLHNFDSSEKAALQRLRNELKLREWVK